MNGVPWHIADEASQLWRDAALIAIGEIKSGEIYNFESDTWTRRK
jgi:hypothetical protein